MADFVHLHNHSDFSLLDGATSVQEMAKKAAEFGMPGLALTDHGNLFGITKFSKACKDFGINAILGCEFYVAEGRRQDKSGMESGNKYHHLVLLAKDADGWRNLVQLSSLSYIEGFYYKPRIDEEILFSFSKGLVCSTACIGGEIPQLIIAGKVEEAEKKALKYREIFGKDSFFLEIQDHGIPEEKLVNKALVALSRKHDLPLLATNDIHYLSKEDARAHDILLCIGTGKKVSDNQRLRFQGTEFYMKSADEMARLFSELPQSLSSSMKINEMCRAKIPMPGPQLPEFEIPVKYDKNQDKLAEPETFRVQTIIQNLDDVTICRPNSESKSVPASDLAPKQRKLLNHRLSLPVTRYFIRASNEGLAQRYKTLTPEIINRLDYELAIIILMDFVGYFLIVADFINWAKDKEIPVGPGRGSGAGSIVAYSLRITDIDPLKYDLLFERFLNPERISMPDFDVDFCNERRNEVIEYVTNKYGKDHVGQIITFGTLKAKAVIKDVARALDISFDESNSIAKLVPESPDMTLEKAFTQEPELAKYEEKYPELFIIARRLENKHRHMSFHAAGIVIGRTKLTDYVPLFRDAKTGIIASQFTMDTLEECGLVKMDFLGLKTLTLIKNTLALLRKKGINLEEEEIPENDPKTFEMLGQGKSTSVFQFESTGMQLILKQAKPTRIEDLIALNALYRPGPKAYIPNFVDSKTGKKPAIYPDPCLKPILEETYGVIVYQEQVIKVAQRIAGYSLGQADMVRRAMGKKKKEILDKERKPFVTGAQKRGFSAEDANRIFDILVPFAEYGFNKSHAAAYSIIAYRTAYLKANHPAEFMAANLTNEIADNDKRADYIAEARSLGIKIISPDINRSGRIFTVDDGNIIYGLLGIKGVGENIACEIETERKKNGPYKSFMAFLERTGTSKLNRKVLESLILAGCFDQFAQNRRTLITNLEKCVEYTNNVENSKAYGQVSLFEVSDENEFLPFEFEELEEYSRSELLVFEKELLGFFISGHPMDEYRKIWERCSDAPISMPSLAEPGRKYTSIAMLREFREITTKSGKKMAFGHIEDFKGSIDIVVFTDVLERYRSLFKIDNVICLTGEIDPGRDKPGLKVESVEEPANLKEKAFRYVHIKLSDGITSEHLLYGIRDALCDMSGSCPVFFHVPATNGDMEIIRSGSHICITASEENLDHLSSLPFIAEVWRE